MPSVTRCSRTSASAVIVVHETLSEPPLRSIVQESRNHELTPGPIDQYPAERSGSRAQHLGPGSQTAGGAHEQEQQKPIDDAHGSRNPLMVKSSTLSGTERLGRSSHGLRVHRGDYDASVRHFGRK